MKRIDIAVLGVVVMLIGGCAGSTTHSESVDLAIAEMMPAKSARQLLEQHLSSEWVNTPWVNCCKFTSSPEKKDRYISFKEISKVHLFQNGDLTICVRCTAIAFGTDEGYAIRGRSFSEKSAVEIATALRSLGATVEFVTISRRAKSK